MTELTPRLSASLAEGGGLTKNETIEGAIKDLNLLFFAIYLSACKLKRMNTRKPR